MNPPLLSVAFAAWLLCSASFAWAGQPTRVEFAGRSDPRERLGFDSPEAFAAANGFGAFAYEALGPDTNPDPRIGVYEVLVTEFQIDFAGDRLELPPLVSTAQVNDNAGCDCFFVNIPYAGVLAGQPFDRLFLNIQNEFGPEAFTMFSDDSLPTAGLYVPPDSWTTLMLYQGADLTIFDIAQETLLFSAVPEPASAVLWSFATAALLGVRRR